MKKFVAALLLLACVFTFVGCGADKAIGTISGAENEYITIDGVTYERDNASDLSNKDRDDYLGQVSNTKISMKVYSVDGDAEGKYIYAMWDWEGAFYIRQEQTQ